MCRPLRIALVQMASSADWRENLAKVTEAMSDVSGRSELVVFPESVLCLACDSSVRAQSRSLAELIEVLGGLAATHGIAAVFGGVPVGATGKPRNAALVFGADGDLVCRYDKMHLFQLDPEGPAGIDETLTYTAGDHAQGFTLSGWRIGLTVCYDLRFPELFRSYAGADLILCTAAFTDETGRAHWQPLLRARAIEGQCYVAGVGQCGENPETGLAMHGHTLVVGPWGEPVAGAPGRQETVVVAELCREAISGSRQRLPALQNRRQEIEPFTWDGRG